MLSVAAYFASSALVLRVLKVSLSQRAGRARQKRVEEHCSQVSGLVSRSLGLEVGGSGSTELEATLNPRCSTSDAEPVLSTEGSSASHGLWAFVVQAKMN